MTFVVPLDQIRMAGLPAVGSRNAMLGEMLHMRADAGIRTPAGVVTTVRAYRKFLSSTGLDIRIRDVLSSLDPGSAAAIAMAGTKIRRWIAEAPLPLEVVAALKKALDRLCAGSRGVYALRTSVMPEIAVDASSAGQQALHLDVIGFEGVLEKMRQEYASLYSDRALFARLRRWGGKGDVAISVCIQEMVPAQCSGTAFTLDPSSGSRDVVFITAAHGRGEAVMQGMVNPDEFHVSKLALGNDDFPIVGRQSGLLLSHIRGAGRECDASLETASVACRDTLSLSDPEIVQLASHATAIERCFQMAMEIEWVKSVADDRLYIVQARRETVWSSTASPA